MDALTVLNDIVDAYPEVAHTEGLCEIFVSTGLQCLFLVFLLCLGCQQDDWKMPVVRIGLDGPGQFEAIHLRHHDIGDNQVE